jgi:hypothetical protein
LIFNSDGTYLGRFGTFGTGIENFGLPNGIAIDNNDYVYIADAGNHRILKFPPLFGPSAPPAEEGDFPIGEEDIFEDIGDSAEEGGSNIVEEEIIPTEAALEGEE